MLYSPGFLGRPKAAVLTLVVAQGLCAGAAALWKLFVRLMVLEIELCALGSSPHGAAFSLAFFYITPNHNGLCVILNRYLLHRQPTGGSVEHLNENFLSDLQQMRSASRPKANCAALARGT